MLVYNYFNGLNFTDDTTTYTLLSFGNMGYSGNSCGMNFIDWGIKEYSGEPTTYVGLQC